MSTSALVRGRLYHARVDSVVEECSRRSGNYYLALRLSIEPSGLRVIQLLIAHENGIKLIKSFCKAARLMDCYKKGEIKPKDCLGKEIGVYLRWDDRYMWQVEAFADPPT